MVTPVKFERPPIVEVACGVLFSTHPPIQTAHIGAFWESVRSQLPRLEDAPPLIPVVEEPDASSLESWEVGSLPPMRRVWMLSNDGKILIQVQPDRFLFNWKRMSEDDSYPSYQNVIKSFEDYLRKFLGFCSAYGISEIRYRQYELTYVNHVGSGNGLNDVGFDSLLIDHMRDSKPRRFLPRPELISWTSAYPLPNEKGRLHITAQTVRHQILKESIVRLDLTARGISPDTTDSGRREWFDMAHEWITQGFADVTNPLLHGEKIWRRTS